MVPGLMGIRRGRRHDPLLVARGKPAAQMRAAIRGSSHARRGRVTAVVLVLGESAARMRAAIRGCIRARRSRVAAVMVLL